MPVSLPDAAPVATILIVDDTEMQRRILTAVVVGLGMRAHAVGSGAACLELLRDQDNEFDAILMDIEMPGMDGLATARAIRAQDGAVSKIPILAVTASACADLGRQARRAGFNLCLEKPVRPADIADGLRSVLLGGAEPLRA